MNRYDANLPANFAATGDLRDAYAAALAALPAPPDAIFADAALAVLTVTYKTVALTPAQITAYQNAVGATAANPAAPWRVTAAQVQFLTAALAVLTNMQAQLGTLTAANYPDYPTANLANLLDLQHKVQAIAGGPARDGTGGLAQLVTGLKNQIRYSLGITDGST